MVGAWMFGDYPKITGETIDQSGNHNDGTLVSAVSSVPGKFGNALDFPGAADYVIANTPIKAFPMSIVCWFNAANVTDTNTLVFIGDVGQPNAFCSLYARGNVTDDPVRAFIHSHDGGSNSSADTTTGYTSGIWHQAVGVWVAPNEIYAYIDGDSVGTAAGGELGDAGPEDWTNVAIGMLRDNSPGSEFTGLIDHVIIYNLAFSVGEVVELYADPFVDWRPDPIYLWSDKTAAVEEGNAGIMTTWGGYWGPTY
jgi:hypothetical protein